MSLGLLPGTEIAVSFSLKHRMGSAFTKFVAQAVVKLLVCKEICTLSRGMWRWGRYSPGPPSTGGLV